MFNWKTLKSKLFWAGVAKVIAGAALISQGHTDTGITLCALGVGAVTGSDRLTKVIQALNEKGR